MDKNIIPADLIPPAAVEIEASILGSIINDREAILKVAPFLKAEKFYLREHQTIFNVMLELFERNDPIDP